MTTYTQLQTDVASWIIGDDVTAQIPTFILLAEERHKWGGVDEDGARTQHRGAIRVRDMERRARTNGSDSQYIALPDPFLEHRSLKFTGTTQRDQELDYVGHEHLEFMQHARPTRYTIVRKEFAFNGIVPTTLELEIFYYVGFTPLSATNATNWLSLNAYGCYLWATIAEGQAYLQDLEAAVFAERKYSQAVKALMRSELRARHSQGMNRVVISGRSTP